jgi:hypothetical protein
VVLELLTSGAALGALGFHLHCRARLRQALDAYGRGDLGIARLWLRQLQGEPWLRYYDREGRVAEALAACNERNPSDRILREIARS